LKTAGIVCSEPTIIAKTGWTTADLLSALDEAEIGGSYDIVTLLIGVNNQYQNIPLEVYQQEFVKLLHRSINYAGGDSSHVLVLSIPDWSVTPFAFKHNRQIIGEQIDQFNRVNLVETKLVEANYINITDISRKAEENITLLTGDGLHPSEKMYTLWVDLIFQTAHKILDNLLKRNK
jgi:lysophospholipase L1-like esterase